MAGEARWSEPAENQYRAYIAYLQRQAPALSREAAVELRAAADLIARRPGAARKARWHGLSEWSVPRWRKLLVLQCDGDAVQVVAMYDMRQDLSAVDPLSE